MNVKAAHKYAGKARSIAKRIKNATDDPALEEAAADMAALVPPGAVLVPAPSSSGHNRAMLVLAQKIAAITGATVQDLIVRTIPVESSHLRRVGGRPAVSVDEHVASMELAEVPPEGVPIIAIDNVVTAGNTLQAMERVIGRPIEAVVYADASRSAPERPRMSGAGAGAGARVRVCFSGSRGFKALWKVEAVMRSIPAGAVVVHGGAEGVDAEAERLALEFGFATEVWEPDWEAYGRAAGPKRNREMVATCDYLYAFWDGQSRGTASAIRAAVEADVDHEVILED